jgi:hypothetical protein
MPAKAGIQTWPHVPEPWIPAYAGMTLVRLRKTRPISEKRSGDEEAIYKTWWNCCQNDRNLRAMVMTPRKSKSAEAFTSQPQQ